MKIIIKAIREKNPQPPTDCIIIIIMAYFILIGLFAKNKIRTRHRPADCCWCCCCIRFWTIINFFFFLFFIFIFFISKTPTRKYPFSDAALTNPKARKLISNHHHRNVKRSCFSTSHTKSFCNYERRKKNLSKLLRTLI